MYAFFMWFFHVLCFQDHCCILHSIIGWNSTIGEWSRVEGTPNDPNPNKPFAKLDVVELFNPDGRLSPSITVIGELLILILQQYFNIYMYVDKRKILGSL